jgi:hypothetical protein
VASVIDRNGLPKKGGGRFQISDFRFQISDFRFQIADSNKKRKALLARAGLLAGSAVQQPIRR